MNEITYKEVLHSPQTVVPSLSEKEIKFVIVETILSYIDRSINLNTVSQVAGALKKYCSPLISISLMRDLEDLYSMYSNEEILVDILDELTSR